MASLPVEVKDHVLELAIRAEEYDAATMGVIDTLISLHNAIEAKREAEKEEKKNEESD